jgi:hypothetical protein
MNTIGAAGIETVNITADDTSTAAADQTAVHTITLTGSAITDVVVTGDAGLNLTATGSTAITNFDASGVTTNSAAVAASAGAGGVTYTSLNVTTGATPTIKGGQGADTLTGATGTAIAETIEGGDGIDTINGGPGVDTLSGGAGNDVFQFETAELLGTDIIDGGDGTNDNISVLDATNTTNVVDADFANMTNVESLTLVAGSAHTVVLGASSLASGVATITATGAGNNSITVGAGHAGNLSVTSGSGDDTITLSAYPAGNTITIAGGGGTDGYVLGAGTENITGGAGVDTLTVGSASYLASTDVINGAGGTDIVNFTAASTVTDAMFSGLSNMETVSAGNVAMTITAGAQAQEAGIATFTMGNATNSVNASAMTSNITITGGTGVDTITSGSGDDTLDGGDGVDTIVFAATAALNGNDAFGANIDVSGANADKFNMSAFLPNATFNSTVVEHNGTSEVNLTNAIVMLAAADGDDAEVDTEAEVAALIEGIGDALHLNSGGKGIVLAGDDNGAVTGFIYFVDDTLDGTNGTISTTDVTTVANFTLDLNTFTAGNFI